MRRISLRRLPAAAALLLAVGAAVSGALLVPRTADAALVITASQSGHTVYPGGDLTEVFRLRMVNTYLVTPETLTAVTFSNRTTGPGTQSQLDSEWTPMIISVIARSSDPGGVGFNGSTFTFSGGLARLSNLKLIILPQDTVTLVLTSSASLLARRNDVLDLRIPANATTFSPPVSVSGPIDPSGTFPVIGMGASEVLVHDVATPQFAIGTQRNLALDLTLPSNGYQADVLQKLNVVNKGDAEGGTDLSLLEAWVDNGDGRFDPTADARLGPLSFTGNRWELTGLSRTVPVGGLRVFVSVDIPDQARVAKTVKLGLPAPPDIAVQMQSGHDGPIDREVTNASMAPITVVDRVILTVDAGKSGAASPGDIGVRLLTLEARNTYSVAQQLTGLVFTNATQGSGTPAQKDAEIQILTLRDDANNDGVLDPATDPVLGTAFFIGGRATFQGLAWNLPKGESHRLFLTADVSLSGAADGDVLAATLSGPADVTFSGAVAVSAGWPLAGDPWSVDGMVAREVTNLGAPGATLGANEGPKAALDVIVPRNGYRDDTLLGFSVINVGTATVSDLAELRLWRDGGDGVFDAGAGDDSNLGTLTYSGGTWTSAPLSQALGAGGARLFVSVTTGGAPTDSATVRLAVPVDGLPVGSGNVGPLDTLVANPQSQLLSNRPLLASVAITPSASTLGQNVTVRMTVRNVGSEAVNGVAPSALATGGAGTLTNLSGPVPASAAIPIGGQQMFAWTYQASAPGDVTLAGSASGTGASSGLTRTSLVAGSNVHRVFSQADSLGFSAFDAMPLSVNRGQTDVIPLYLTFTNLGGTSGSDVRVRALSVRLETSGGTGIIPADLLSRVGVTEGGTTYLDRTGLETSGADVDLTLATPILVSASRPVTVALRLDLLAATLVQNFRVVIPDGGRFTAEDATSGAPVSIAIQGGSFPIRSGVARVVAEATELDVSALAAAPVPVGRGQLDATLLTTHLANPGVPGVGSDVRSSAFTVGLVDTNGVRIANPAVLLKRIRVRNGPQTIADQPVNAPAESLIAITLSPLVAVPAGSPVDLRISADVADSAALGAFRLRLADSSLFDARDANTGAIVPVRYAGGTVQGPVVTVQARADTALARGVPMLPPNVGVGSRSVGALAVVLRHPGGPASARLRIDSLSVRCVDESRNPLVPSIFLDALHVLWNGVEVAAVTAPPSVGNAIGVALPGMTIAPADSDTVMVTLDFNYSPPPSSFELTMSATGITAVDANVALPAAVVTYGGAEFPLLSGLTRLSPPARDMTAGLADQMPANLAPDGRPLTVARITLTSLAPAGSGTIAIDRFTLRAADAARRPIAMSAGAALISLEQAGTPWAQAAGGAADTLTLIAGLPLQLQPGQPVTLDLRLTPTLMPTASTFRLGFGAADVGVIQPSNPLLQIAVQPASGSFPLWTEAGSFSATGLAASYSNYPNPFAAGRQATTFAWYMPSAGRVTLRVWTARGERVASLLDGVARPAGLQQGDAWDGRNGRGVAVVNGVYVAELSVAFDDGTSQRVLRRVAVVR